MQSLCPYIPVITKPWDFSMNLHGCKIFSKIYLIRAYHQVPDSRIRCVQNRSHYWTPIWSIRIFKNDVRCKKRCENLSTVYRWNSSMYVLIFAYIDDLLIFSETADEHSKHLPTVFDKLTDGVTINPSKSLFSRSWVPKLPNPWERDYLHILGANTCNFPAPDSIAKLLRPTCGRTQRRTLWPPISTSKTRPVKQTFLLGRSLQRRV